MAAEPREKQILISKGRADMLNMVCSMSDWMTENPAETRNPLNSRSGSRLIGIFNVHFCRLIDPSERFRRQ